MSNDFHWGGISIKGLCKAIIIDLWMVFAVMAIVYFGLGTAESMRYTPLYTSNTVVAVYPFNKMYTLEASSNALETVSAVNEVFNSEMFRTGLKDRLTESVDFSLESHQIDRTYILMLSASSSSPENAYRTLRGALDYYDEISSHLVGDSQLEILSEPDFPTSVSNESRILKYRSLLTLLMGLAMGCFIVLMYAIRRTYKTSTSIENYYRNVRFFKVKTSALNRHSVKTVRKFQKVPNQEAVRKTSLELMQILRAKSGNSIYVTSATQNEGKTEVTVSLAREMVDSGKSVIIIETDSENIEMSDQLGLSDNQQRYKLSDLLKDGIDLVSIIADVPDQNTKVIFANKIDTQNDFSYRAKDVEKLLEQAGKIADLILIDGCIWTGSRDERIWKESTDVSLAVCRQDKADFFSIDQMMTDLQENNPDFLGCVLYGF